jgi:hypothetical protein
MNRTPEVPLTGVDRPAETPNNRNSTGLGCSGQSSTGWTIPLEIFLASAVLSFLCTRLEFPTPFPPRLRLPVFPYALHPISGRKVLHAPRRRFGGARLF